jgi:hypothetical protein
MIFLSAILVLASETEGIDASATSKRAVVAFPINSRSLACTPPP